MVGAVGKESGPIDSAGITCIIKGVCWCDNHKPVAGKVRRQIVGCQACSRCCMGKKDYRVFPRSWRSVQADADSPSIKLNIARLTSRWIPDSNVHAEGGLRIPYAYGAETRLRQIRSRPFCKGLRHSVARKNSNKQGQHHDNSTLRHGQAVFRASVVKRSRQGTRMRRSQGRSQKAR